MTVAKTLLDSPTSSSTEAMEGDASTNVTFLDMGKYCGGGGG